jgi:hypothetical protein
MRSAGGACAVLVYRIAYVFSGLDANWEDLRRPHLILLAARIRLAEIDQTRKDKHGP